MVKVTKRFVLQIIINLTIRPVLLLSHIEYFQKFVNIIIILYRGT